MGRGQSFGGMAAPVSGFSSELIAGRLSSGAMIWLGFSTVCCRTSALGALIVFFPARLRQPAVVNVIRSAGACPPERTGRLRDGQAARIEMQSAGRGRRVL